MEFDWDDAKAESNLAKHRVSFDYAVAVFLDPMLVDFDATRQEDGETRRKVVGIIEGRLYSVVYTPRGVVFRLISARRSSAKEEKYYGSLHARSE
jgi:uncharacterized DUF497 family protein